MAILEEKQSSKSGYFGGFFFSTKMFCVSVSLDFFGHQKPKIHPAHPPTQKLKKKNKINYIYMQVWSLFMFLFQQDFVSKAKWGSLFGFCEKMQF